MTKHQQKLVISWAFSLFVFLLMIIAADKEATFWAAIQWALIGAITFHYLLNQKRFKHGNKLPNPTPIIERYPFIKTWLLIYMFFIISCLLYVSTYNYNFINEFGYGSLLLMLAPIFLPFILVDQIDKYNERG